MVTGQTSDDLITNVVLAGKTLEIRSRSRKRWAEGDHKQRLRHSSSGEELVARDAVQKLVLTFSE
jgi:hypothetical protein